MMGAQISKDSPRKRSGPLQARSKKTVEAILNSAAGLFATRKFSQVKVADLAAAAGVGIGTFYHHFPSKEALLLKLREDMLTRTFVELGQRFSTRIEHPRDLMDGLGELITAWVHMGVEHAGLEKAVTALSFESDEVAEVLKAQEESVRALVASMLKAHQPFIRDLDPDRAAKAIVVLVEATVRRAMREPELAKNPAPLIQEVVLMITHHVLPDPKAH
jgi:AcrR family transcriptional regulator